jgi:hypothetical protein
MSRPDLIKNLTLPKEWNYPPSLLYSDKQAQAIQDSGNGVLLRLPRPLDAHEAISSELFQQDMNHPSAAGHQFIANLIIEKLEQIKFRTNHDETLRPFDLIDQCEAWIRTGDTSIRRDTNLVMNEFKPGKFALEARSPHTWFKVFNENRIPAVLRLLYMATSPDCLYSSTRLSIEGGDSVEVTCKKLEYTWDVHVSQQIHVGKVPPGESIVRVDALEGGGQWPFRLVGVLLMPDDCDNRMVVDRLRCTTMPNINGRVMDGLQPYYEQR